MNNETAGTAADTAQIPRIVLPQQAVMDVEEVEPDVPPPEYILVDEHGQVMDEHGKKQRQGRELRALFQRKRSGEEEMVRVE